jgi:hypothetical protein
MIETEVARLRRLRNSALRVRAVARALADTRAVHGDPLLGNAACAAWRVARAVSGHLRGHPYVRFQRDAGIGSIVANSVVATGEAVIATNRTKAFKTLSRRLRKMLRELEDARAVTLTPDLSDAFGRSLSEFRPMLAQAELEARPVARQRSGVPVRGAAHAAYGASTDGDWPYLAL